MYPVGLMVTAVAVTTVAITEVIAPGTTEKVIKKISENVIPKVEPIAVPVSNTVPKADCEELKRKKKEAKEASRGQSCKKLCIPEHPTASVSDEYYQCFAWCCNLYHERYRNRPILWCAVFSSKRCY